MMTKMVNSQVELHPIEMEEKEVLRNLLSLYLHDLSEFLETIEISENGRFEFDGLDLYFEGPVFHPMFIRIDGELAGFILMTEIPYVKLGCDYCIQEFFIMKKYRGKGIAIEAVRQLYQRFPGKFCLMVLEKNLLALHFWRKAHEENHFSYEEGMMTLEDSTRCYYQIFPTN